MILTKSAFAQRMGVDRAQPTRWAARGMPVLADGRVNVEEAEAWVARNLDGTQRRRRGVGRRMGALAEVPDPRDRSPFDQTCVCAINTAVFMMPGTVARAAVEAGASLPVAFALHRLMLTRGVDLADRALSFLGVPLEHPDPDYVPASTVLDWCPPDWAALAESAGEPLDLEAWAAQAEARGISAPPPEEDDEP